MNVDKRKLIYVTYNRGRVHKTSITRIIEIKGILEIVIQQASCDFGWQGPENLQEWGFCLSRQLVSELAWSGRSFCEKY